MHVLRRAPRGLALVVIAGVGLATVAGCSSDDPSTSDGRPDRGAQEQDVSSGWDVEFHVVIANATTQPIEIGVSSDPAARPDRKELVTSVTAGMQPQAAGVLSAYVVPPSPDGGQTAQELDLFVQQKLGTPRVVENAAAGGLDPDGSEELLLTLPTMQLRIRTDFDWGPCQKRAGKPYCTYERVTTVNVQTRTASGWQAPYREVHRCYDPTELPRFDQEIGDPTSTWNAIPAADFDRVTIEVRSAAEMKRQTCADQEHPSMQLPGMSLGFDQPPPGGVGVNLSAKKFAGPQMPGADLRWANLTKFDVSGGPIANLAYARFDHANLSDANLSNAILAGARFDGAKVTGVVLNGAVLSDVDLRSTAAPLPWDRVKDAKLCRTLLPEATLEEYAAAHDGELPDLNADCDTQISAMLGLARANGTIIDTASTVPLTLLLQSGNFDCALPSAVGSFGVVYHPPKGCWGYYGSSRLVRTAAADDGTPRTTTTQPEGQPPRNVVNDGGVTIADAGAVSPDDGLAISEGALTNGWKGLVCLAVQRDEVSGRCLDQHRPLPAGS